MRFAPLKAVAKGFALEIVAEMALKALQLNPHAQPVSIPLSASISCVSAEQMPTMEKKHKAPTIDSLSINAIRTPNMDAVQQANSDTLCSRRINL